MIKPNPFKIKCENCGWSKIIAPKSDALNPLDFPSKCPKCNSEELEIVEMSIIDKILNNFDIFTLIKK